MFRLTHLGPNRIQLNFLSTATLGTEESGRREVTVTDGFKQESMYGMSAKKGAVVERWPL